MNQNNYESDAPNDEIDALTRTTSPAYVEKEKQLENMKSTAYTFIPISLLGFVALILMWLDLLPLQIAFYMKCIYTIVLGGLLIFFFITGIKSFFQIKLLTDQVTKEHDTTQEIFEYFEKNYSRQDFSTNEENSDYTMEQLYFLRIERIQSILNSEFDHLNESFVEHICEEVYQTFFPDEI